jgi:hypothetical protein
MKLPRDLEGAARVSFVSWIHNLTVKSVASEMRPYRSTDFGGLLLESGQREVDADGAADHVEGRHSFE